MRQLPHVARVLALLLLPRAAAWPVGVKAVRGQPMNRSVAHVCNFDRFSSRNVSISAEESARIVAALDNVAEAPDYWAYAERKQDFAPGALLVFRDIKREAHTAPPSSVLIFIAGACENCHLLRLQSCWPRVLGQAPLLRTADVLFYGGCGHNGNEVLWSHVKKHFSLPAAPWIDALQRLPNANVSVAWTRFNKGGLQQGATMPMLIAHQRMWFESYEWVIRANPDVAFLDPTVLVNNMQDPTVSAVMWTCHQNLPSTDVFATRVSAMDAQHWATRANSLERRANIVFARALRQGNVSLYERTGAGQKEGPACRVASFGVLHSHAHCGRRPHAPSHARRLSDSTQTVRLLQCPGST